MLFFFIDSSFGTITLTPLISSLYRAGTHTYTANINGVPYNNLQWSVPVGPGSITNGVYSAPWYTAVPSISTTIRATSLDDLSKFSEDSFDILKNAPIIRRALTLRSGNHVSGSGTTFIGGAGPCTAVTPGTLISSFFIVTGKQIGRAHV